MNELDVLELFINELESVIDSTVQMSQHDEDHQADMVLIDNFDTDRKLRSTNPYIGIRDGKEVLQYYFDARLDLLVVNENEVEAYKTRQKIVDHFSVYERRPKELDDDIVKFELGGGGQREAQFEPSVFRLFRQVQSFNFSFTNEREVDADILEEIEDNLGI